MKIYNKAYMKKAQALIIVIMVLAIVGIIALAVSSRVIKSMRLASEKKRLNMSYSYASGAIDKVSDIYNKGQLASSSYCEQINSDQYKCNITSGSSGLFEGTVERGCTGYVIVKGDRSITNEIMAKDDVLEINVDGMSSGSLNIYFDNLLGKGILIKTVQYNSNTRDYIVVNENMYCSSSFFVNTRNCIFLTGNTITYSLPAASGAVTNKVVRIKLIGGSATLSVTGSAQYQKNIYVSEFNCAGVVTKEVRTEWLNAGVPEMFDFVLYNEDGSLSIQ